jgi:bifunctional DNA primase/polymerase-like protein/primase-like protein
MSGSNGRPTTLEAWALKYAEHGWPVFPVQAKGKGPLTLSGFKDATTEAEQIRKWWATWPDANIGFVPGRANPRLLSIDMDGPEGEAAAQHLGLLAEPTLSARTARGRHLYFAHPGGTIDNTPLAPHLDVRADAGYVVLPPSEHPSGKRYCWAGSHEVDLKRLPPPVLTLFNGAGRARAAPPLPEQIPQGARNTTLTSLAGSMRRRSASEETILAALRAENAARCRPPLEDDELEAIALSVARYAPAPTANPSPPAEPRTPWACAVPAPEFLAGTDAGTPFLKPKLVARSCVSELFSPRGLGKTHVGHALAIELARAGYRVLLLDRDNAPREVRRRLKGWDGSVPLLRVLTREQVPPLTDVRAWADFPTADYDVVLLDSLDAATEGVGEQDSSRPSRALAPILDLARRPEGPGIVVLGNTVKSAAHSRGSGVVEDRADIVYEVRDATDLRPTGSKPWWQELPPAGAEAWAERAARRKHRTVYRLALIASKFRVGEEPEPFVLEINLGAEPWTLRDVTGDLVAAGEASRAAAAAARQAELDDAAKALRAVVEAGERPNRETAIARLMEEGLTQKAARELLRERDGKDWRTVVLEDRPGRPRVLDPPEGSKNDAPTEIRPRETPATAGTISGDFGQPLESLDQRKCPEIDQAALEFPEGGISVGPISVPGSDGQEWPDLDPDEEARDAVREGA